MFDTKYCKSSSLIFALIISTSSMGSFFTSTPVVADTPDSQSSISSYLKREPVILHAGAIIAVMYERDKILLSKDETIDVTLKVAGDVKTGEGNILIPYGAQILGRLQPEAQGTRFVAETLVIEGKQIPLTAVSGVVTRIEIVKQGSDINKILEGSAIGAGGATIIASFTGGRAIANKEIIGGAGLGALTGWVFGDSQAELISIAPNLDLTLTLESDLVLK